MLPLPLDGSCAELMAADEKSLSPDDYCRCLATVRPRDEVAEVVLSILLDTRATLRDAWQRAQKKFLELVLMSARSCPSVVGRNLRRLVSVHHLLLWMLFKSSNQVVLYFFCDWFLVCSLGSTS